MSAGSPARVVAVDLTPVLPGGENGGAKLFAVELVRRLAARAPGTRFLLLTQAASHEELASLDGDNVERLQVVGAAASAGRTQAFGIASRVVRRMPAWVRRRAAGVGYEVFSRLKRGGASRPLRDRGVGLLFCPFTAPTFREPGIPVVATIYDVQFHAYPQFFSVEDAAQRARAFRDACRHATRLAAISEFSRASAIKVGGLAPGRIRAIPLFGLAPPYVAADAAPGSTAAPYFLYPANFWKHKNHEMLLAAFGMACRAGLPPGMRLVCTGAPGERRDWLGQAAAALGLADRVAFPGFVSRAEYGALLAGARGLVFPSLYEGFGLPLPEAMAAGVPIACSDATSLPEVAGDAALLFDPRVPGDIAQALVALAADESLRARLIEAGRRRAPLYADPDRVAAAYEALFEEALVHRGERAAA